MKYVTLESIEELSKIMQELSELKASYSIIAGGTDFMIDWKNHRSQYLKLEYILDISNIKEMEGIKDLGDRVWIGSVTKIEEIRESEIIRKLFSALFEASEKFATWQIRNMATIGGNICTASPASTLAPALLIYNAEVEIGPLQKRIMPLVEFFKGPKKNALKPYEIVMGIYLRKQDGMMGVYEELGKREGNIIAIVNCAVGIKKAENTSIIDDVRIALGSVSPTPIRAYTAEKYLKEKVFTQEIIEEGAKAVLSDINPITDFRASKEYRQRMAIVLVKRALKKLLGDE